MFPTGWRISAVGSRSDVGSLSAGGILLAGGCTVGSILGLRPRIPVVPKDVVRLQIVVVCAATTIS